MHSIGQSHQCCLSSNYIVGSLVPICQITVYQIADHFTLQHGKMGTLDIYCVLTATAGLKRPCSPAFDNVNNATPARGSLLTKWTCRLWFAATIIFICSQIILMVSLTSTNTYPAAHEFPQCYRMNGGSGNNDI